MDKHTRLINVLPLALVTALGLQSLRVLLSLFQQYLRDSVGLPSLNLAPIALAVFALAFLPGLVVKRAGLKTVLGFSMAAVPLLRLAEQISRDSLADLLLSSAAVVFFWWFLACAFSALAHADGQGRTFPVWLLAGLALDTAVHAAAGTLDLSWQTGFTPIGIVLLLAGLAFTVGRPWRERVFSGIQGEPGHKQGLTPLLLVPRRMIAFGPWLVLEMMLFQNVARTAALSGWSLPASGLAVVAGNALALLYLGFRPDTGRGAAWLSGLLVTLLLLFPAVPGLTGIAWLLAGQILMAVWLAAIAFEPSGGKPGGSFGPAAVIFVVAVFVYYASYDIPLGVVGMQFLPGFGALLFLAGFAASGGAPRSERNGRSIQPALAAAVLILLPAVTWLTWQRPDAQPPAAGNRELRVLTYNLHTGFDTDGQLAIEALAQQIEASGAEVVGLQEVSRGYLPSGSLDMLGWLSHRLEMPYVFAPTADPQWGLTLLSRYPIVDAEVHSLPPDDLLLLRGYIRATIDIGGGDVTIIVTHLHHRAVDGEIREQQVAALVSAWSAEPGTVIVGDLNSTPETPEMQMFAETGLLNASGISGLPAFTFPSTSPVRQLDYIWYSPDLAGSDFRVYLSQASDHFPVAVTLTIP